MGGRVKGSGLLLVVNKDGVAVGCWRAYEVQRLLQPLNFLFWSKSGRADVG